MVKFQTNTTESRRKQIKNLISAVAVPLMLATTLAACNSNPAISTTQPQNYQYVHTIQLEPSYTVDALEQAYQGEVVAWQPEDGFAIVASNLQTPVSNRNTRGLETLFTSIVTAVTSILPGTSTTTTTTATTTTTTNNGLVMIAEGRKMAYASGRKMAYASGTVANTFIGAMSDWQNIFCTGWCGTTIDIGYGTVSLRNLVALTGTGGSGGIRLSGAQKLAPKLGQGVKVAIIDSGVDLQHPGLKGVAGDASQPNHLAPSADWKDFVDKDAIPQEVAATDNSDGYGHGTGVAGVVLQVAPKALIMPIRVLAADGSGDVANLSSAIQWAVNHGAKIINLSLGTLDRIDAVATMIKWAASKGVYVVTASGNSNDKLVTYPAADATDATRGGAKVISVGSVGSGNVIGALLGGTDTVAAGADQKSGYSTFGAQVELFAPGELMTTLLPENQTGDWTGTSFAAPVVSGALALALAEPLTTSQKALVETAITSTALNIDACNSSLAGQLGKGRLDVEAFLRKVLGKPSVVPLACSK
jgi:thermitase